MFLAKPLFNTSLNTQLIVLRLLYVANFGYAFAIPVMVLYAGDMLGHAEYYFYFVTISSLAGLFLGIPIGHLADKMSRRAMILTGIGLHTLSWACFAAVSPGGDLLFALSFVIRGIASTLCASCISPYLMDILSHHGEEERYRAEESKKASYGMPALTLVTASAGYFYTISPSIPFAMNSVFLGILTLCFILFMPCVKEQQSKKSTPDIYHTPRQKIKALLNPRNELLWLMITTATWINMMGYILFIIQTRMIDINLPATAISLVIASVYLPRAWGAWCINKWQKPKHVTRTGFIAIILLASMSLLTDLWFMAAIVLLFSFGREFVTASINVQLTLNSPDSQRSLVRGLESTYQRIFSITINLLTGFIISHYGGQGALIFSALTLLIITGGSWLIFIKKRA